MIIKNKQILTLKEVFAQNRSIDEVRKNIVSFSIFYRDLDYDLIAENRIDWFILIANLAGLCGGSFLGISLISIFELLEYCLIFVGIIFVGVFKKLKIRPT